MAEERRTQMTRANLLLVVAGLMLVCTLPALADDPNGSPGTVNYFTPAQKARAFRIATGAGYTPTVVEAFQDGNFFLTATKNGQAYELTVLPSGQFYASSPIPASNGKST